MARVVKLPGFTERAYNKASIKRTNRGHAMRGFVLALCAVLFLGQAAVGQSSNPSPAMISMRDLFEAEVLTIEDKYPDNNNDFIEAVAAIADRVFGADWNVVREEAKRTLANLPEIDLAPYAKLKESPAAFAANGAGSGPGQFLPFMGPAGYAMMRFWDAEAVGRYVAVISVLPDRNSIVVNGLRSTLVPSRVFKSRFANRDVLATRWMRSMVIAPYSITIEGFIQPDFENVRVYALQH